MGSLQTSPSWLDILQEQLDVDIDCMDPNEAKKWLPFKPQDQTSNQRLVYEQMISPDNQQMFLQAVRECKGQGWEAVLDRVSAQLCAKNIENIRGRVLLQSSPGAAYDTAKVVAHARSYARELEKVGITKDRFCIKIPCTGPALNASRILRKEGIRTLGTSVFSVAQAIAASQAECLSISPYFNLPCYHANADLWPDVADPALQHPMAPRIVQMLDKFRQMHEQTGKEQPMLKPASFKSAREAMAMAELGCHNATIPEDIIQQLSLLDFAHHQPAGDFSSKHTGLPTKRLAHLSSIDPLVGPGWNGKLASADIDYLADNGAALTRAIAEDPVTAQGLHEAIEAFIANEMQSKVAITEMMAQV